MSAYLFIELTVHDREQFLVYAAAARGIAPKFGGEYLSAGRPAEVLEGNGVTAPVVLTRWPSSDHIRRFWNSDEYQAAIKLREGAAKVEATILEGNEEEKIREPDGEGKS